MHDLNDLYYFAMVVDHGGFAAAERTGYSKSRLSRHIRLETDLGVRLLQRSTRRFAVTDVGTSVHRHARTMLAGAEPARWWTASARSRAAWCAPAVAGGGADASCPSCRPFLEQYPKVRLQRTSATAAWTSSTKATTWPLRVRSRLDDGSLVMRSFGQVQELLVASPKYLDRASSKDPEELTQHVTLSIGEDEARQRWELHGPEGEVRRVDLQPRVVSLLQSMVKDGFGITMLPETVCADAVRNGELEVVLPDWSLPQGVCMPCSPASRPAGSARVHRLPGQYRAAGGLARLDCGGACESQGADQGQCAGRVGSGCG